MIIVAKQLMTPIYSLDILNQHIPDHVFADRHKCLEFNNCVQQNGEDFGFILLTPLKVYNGDPIHYAQIPDIITAHKFGTQTGIPNFLGARIPIASQLNPLTWHSYLAQFWDKQLLDLIEYGFPLNFHRDRILHSTETNHVLALQYIMEEVSYSAIHGPCHEKPFPMHIYSLIMRDKPNSNKKRTIMDLSWPKGFSVNHGVSRNSYLDTYFTLHYPSLDHITQAIRNLGADALLYKIDISKAFRHLRIDLGDLDILGFHHNDYYFDGSLAFGYRHGSVFFQHYSDAIRYIMKNYGFYTMFNYIDNLIYVGLPHEIHQSFTFLQHFLDTYNDTTYYKVTEQDAQVHLDVSLTGLGGIYGCLVYALPIPRGYCDYSIVHLEKLNILVACKIWASHWENKKIQIFCDNLTVVEVLTSGRTRDETLATCAHNIWLLSALYNIHFTFSHIVGVQNAIADLLSRWGNSQHDWWKLRSLCPDHIWVDSHIDLTLLNYTI